MKPLYLTVYMTLGGRAYTVDCRILPPRAEAHVGADSPRFLDPGSLPRVQVLRILHDAVEVTTELNHWTRREIEDAARKGA